MKKNKNIIWKKYFGKNIKVWIPWFSKVLLDALCATFFLCAARIMLRDVYSWLVLSASSVWMFFTLAIVISAAMELAEHLSDKKRISGSLGILLIWAAFCVGLAVFWNVEHIFSGMQKMLSAYVEDWNDYYHTAISFSEGKFRHIRQSLEFLTIVLFGGLLWCAKRWKSNLILLPLPCFVLILELMVGYSPGYGGLLLCFVAVLLSNTYPWTGTEASKNKSDRWENVRYFSWIAIGSGAYLLCVVISFSGTPLAEKLLVYSNDMKESINDSMEKMGTVSGEKGSGYKRDSEKVRITNTSPKYENKTVMRIELDKKPEGSVYLKGFCATDYKRGQWKSDTGSFSQNCKEAGFNVEEMSEYVMTLGNRKVYDKYHVDKLQETDSVSQWTMVTLTDDKKVYLPYFSEIRNVSLFAYGDEYYGTEKKPDKLKLYLWDGGAGYLQNLTLTQEGATSDWEKWYRKFVMEYDLQVPDYLPSVTAIAKELEKQVNEEYLYQYGKNELRLKKTDLVVQWMANHMEYSLTLEDVPDAYDPIEYFLGNSRTGYCMHFASASVMILRKMGVPARYASGYILKASSVKGQNGKYYAFIKDKNAHAWVEIYLDDIGWVPVEVTKGYSMDTDEGVEEADDAENFQPVTADAIDHTETVEPLVEKPEEETEEQQDEAEATEEHKQEVKDTVGKNSGQHRGVLVQCLFCAIAVILISGIIYGIFRYKGKNQKGLQTAIRQKRTVSAILIMNRTIYKHLCRHGKIVEDNIRDDDYKTVLMEQYPEISREDWEYYMELVKAAAFSKKKFSVEEMNFCYEIYNRVVKGR